MALPTCPTCNGQPLEWRAFGEAAERAPGRSWLERLHLVRGRCRVCGYTRQEAPGGSEWVEERKAEVQQAANRVRAQNGRKARPRMGWQQQIILNEPKR